jgi:hypothetical protein
MHAPASCILNVNRFLVAQKNDRVSAARIETHQLKPFCESRRLGPKPAKTLVDSGQESNHFWDGLIPAHIRRSQLGVSGEARIRGPAWNMAGQCDSL